MVKSSPFAFLALIAIAVACVACIAGSGQPTLDVGATMLPKTSTRTPFTPQPTWTETATPTPTITPLPSSTVTPTRAPAVWQIWFYGHTCILPDGLPVGDCGPAWTVDGESYFTIASDGTGLEPLDVTGVPPTPTLPPNFSPTDEYWVEITTSPDGAYAAYIQDGNALLVAPSNGGEPALIYQAGKYSQNKHLTISSPCWNADSSAIRFVVTGWDSNRRRVPWVYTVRPDGSDLDVLVVLTGFDIMGRGACSPDHQELVFSSWSSDATHAGIYKMNLTTGEMVPILQGYHVALIATAPIK